MQKNRYFYKFFIVIILLLVSCSSCNEFWGDHPLGNELSLLEGDKKEDRIIVYCSARSAGACYAGMPIIPVYNRQFKNGKYEEYVETAKFNTKWVIVKTFVIS